MARETHHVVPNDDGKWAVRRGGSERASALTNTKSEAEKIARDISRNQGTELIIHGKDGKIQRADSHGNDPCPPKDKK